MHQINDQRLANGVRLIHIQLPASPTTVFQVIYGVGARDESPSENGISHALEHMVWRGTPTRPNSIIIAKELERIGALNNAYTSHEVTSYWAVAAGSQWRKIGDVLADIVHNAYFSAEDIAIEMGAIVEEIGMYHDDPDGRCSDLLQTALYGDSSLGRPVLGPKENVLAFTTESFTSYVARHYAPTNTNVVVAGNVDTDELRKFVEEHFGRNVARPDLRNRLVQARTAAVPRFAYECRPDLKQAKVNIGFPAFGHDDPRLPALKLLAVALGGLTSSRLFDQIREKRGWAYSIGAYPVYYQNAGHLVIGAGLCLETLEEAFLVIVNELAKVKESGFTEDEIAVAKGYYEGSNALRCETSQQIASLYASQAATTGRLVQPEEGLAKILRVTNEEMIAAARAVFRGSELRLALVSPVSDLAPFEKLAEKLGD